MTEERSPVLFLGDSITAQGSWDSWLPDEQTLNQGISGDTTDGVLARLDAVVAEQPEVIVLLIGTNDFGNHRASAEHVVRNVETILVTLRRELPGVRLLLVSVLPRQAEYTAKIEEANRHLRQFVATCHAQYLDAWPALADGDHLDDRFTDDGLHLTDEGYRAYLDELVPALERVRGLPPMSRSFTAIDLDEAPA
ncbi:MULTISPECIES: GDSL-type esterase/lipase family protein [unclassified Curtobacterium]|uniref:GDSL-type esterase/lipase family protein n=1 Tax=unclassified Curtobacterium TaxID=257496 RepID=UPI000F461DB9|nr:MULTISPECIES: GDSL-type esterase/lipase family protein [unclassified Curtobacterium]ROQ07659.1 lysophospholipase L1-like esterase [Curtobacterium sp. PhB171]ROQ23730.1 lysophospholipase L1-like esterase [Curtobacterium sp. PhB170]ROS35644.1 lysophospholipase L1-like esterase [Curtobacterium sp. PhB131]ROS69753.1 lysophospholipase L1-like esterase [Curtobacterium sp. PhB141]